MYFIKLDREKVFRNIKKLKVHKNYTFLLKFTCTCLVLFYYLFYQLNIFLNFNYFVCSKFNDPENLYQFCFRNLKLIKNIIIFFKPIVLMK